MKMIKTKLDLCEKNIKPPAATRLKLNTNDLTIGTEANFLSIF